ncbi:MAG: response regulator [Gammaproteobacteria bacterium]|nr:response regulator [Gammaproteobacteria bacterium]
MTIGQTLPDHFSLSWFLPALMVNWIVPIMVMGLFRPSVDGRVCAVWLGLKLISSAFWMLHEVKRGHRGMTLMTPDFAACLVLDGVLWGVLVFLLVTLPGNDGEYLLAIGASAALMVWRCPPGLGRRLFLAPIMALAAAGALQVETSEERSLALGALVAASALFVATRGRVPSGAPLALDAGSAGLEPTANAQVPAAEAPEQEAATTVSAHQAADVHWFERDASSTLPPHKHPNNPVGAPRPLAAAALQLEASPFDLVAMTAEVYRQFRAAAIEKGLLLVLESNLGKEAWVLGDRTRLAQILGCLLKNALTYTLRGCITLKVNHLGSDLVVEVTDTGVGMSERRQHEILDVLEGDSASSPEAPLGVGHGLSQVWRLTTAMHGAPALNSQPGLGTTVSISAPWQAASFTALSAVATPPQPKAGPSVLVVDDDDGCADLLLAFLNVLGIEASRVANGREAVRRFEMAGASLILMDCWMPEMDGFEATRIIRGYERELGLPPVPIIAVTANAFVHERDAALAAGMTSHLAKPFSMMQLAEMIETYAPETSKVSDAGDASITSHLS